MGIASYNRSYDDNDKGPGGRIRYPVLRLDDAAPSGPRSYLITAAANDATQAGSLGSGLSTSANPLKLDNSAGVTVANYVGLRYTGVDIPLNAKVLSATLMLTPAVTATGTGVWEVAMDPSDAVGFDSANHLDSSRWLGGPTPTTHTLGAWVKDVSYAIDVTAMLQAQVNNTAAYCGGQAMAFRLRDTLGLGTGSKREFYSFESSATNKAPKLLVNYQLPAPGSSTCNRVTLQKKVAASADDAIDSPFSSSATSATLSSSVLVGLRFASMGLPANAQIVSAELRLQTNQTLGSAPGVITLKGIARNNLAAFSSSNKVSTQPLSGSTMWSPTSWSGTMTSPGLKSIIQSLVNQSGWSSSSAVGLTVQCTSGCKTFSIPSYFLRDKGASFAPELVVSYVVAGAAGAITRTVRKDLLDVVDNYTLDTWTPLGESYYEAARYMMGQTAYYGRAYAPVSAGRVLYADSALAMNTENLYQSPIDGGACQSNSIIVLTDGVPTQDSNAMTVTATGANGSCSTASGSWDCMNKTAEFLYKTGRPIMGSTKPSKIKTYTIGFGEDVTQDPAKSGLEGVAKKGGGSFYLAADANALTSIFNAILNNIQDSNGSMAAPGVAVNQLNRSQNLDQLYYGMFKPATTQRWAGNLKRYRLGTTAIVDVKGNNALTSDGQAFSKEAQSFWSAEVDGDNADQGGAASLQKAARTIYMDSGAAGSLTELTPAAPRGIDPDNVRWLQGLDVDGTDKTVARETMGAPIHAQPVLVSYGATNEDFVVFIATNDGLLHSINAHDGTENWAWLPLSLKDNLEALRKNNAMGADNKPIYGLDGSWTLVPKTGTKGLLVGGIRQGGSNIYALKLPNDKAEVPKLAWIITPNSSGFSNLGNTWSQPYPIKVRVGESVVQALVFAGGLDYAKYESGGAAAMATPGTTGNAIYIVNAETGALMWSAGATGTATESYSVQSAMKYSMPGGVRALDQDGDGLSDHLYVGDMGGQVFRVDINNRSNTGANLVVTRVLLLAQLGNAAQQGAETKASDRRFYEAPGIAYVSELSKDAMGKDVTTVYAAVTMGSGDRNWPTSDSTTQDSFFLLKDYDAARFDTVTEANLQIKSSAPIKLDQLADVTTKYGADAITALNDKKGWYIKMATKEKVLSSPFIFSRYDGATQKLVYEINFNSFVPDGGLVTECSIVTGTTSAWRVLLANGSSARAGVTGEGAEAGTSGGRSVGNVAGGIAGSDVALVVADTDGKLILRTLTGTNTDADDGAVIDGGSCDKGDRCLPPGFGQVNRKRWYEKQSN